MGPNSTHWNGTGSHIVVNRLVNREVGISDLVTQEIRSIEIILGEEIIVSGHSLFLVGLARPIQVSYPLRLYVA